jgi:pimeloyl-ACP methyl ester carboxylesterase
MQQYHRGVRPPPVRGAVIPDRESLSRRGLVHTLPGAHVAYDVHGDGPDVVLIHGWTCRRTDFDGVVADLARDHRVLALDLPWHGDSTATSRHWTMDDLAAVVDAVAVAEGMREAAIVGHSMGAAVAVETVLAGTGHRVISLDGLTYMHMYPRQSAEATSAFLDPFRADFDAAMRDLCTRAAGPDCDSALVKEVGDTMCAVPPDVAIGMMEQLMRWDMDGALARADALALSVQVFAAAALLSHEAVDRYGHRIDIVPVDLGGHFFLLQHPVKTSQLIRGAIAS